MSSHDAVEATPASRRGFLRYVGGVLGVSAVAAGLLIVREVRSTRAELDSVVTELQGAGLLVALAPTRQPLDEQGAAALTWLEQAGPATSETWDHTELGDLSYEELQSAARAEAAALGLDSGALEGEGCDPAELEAWLRAAVETSATAPELPVGSGCARELVALLTRFDRGGLEFARQVVSQPRLTRDQLMSGSDEEYFLSIPQVPVLELRPVLERLALAARLEAAAGDTDACVADLRAGFAAAELTVELDWWLGALSWMSSEELMLATLRETLPALEGHDLSELEARIEQYDPLAVARAALLGEAAAVHDLFLRMERGDVELDQVLPRGVGTPWYLRWMLEQDHLWFLRELRAQLSELERPPGSSEPAAPSQKSSSVLGLAEAVSVHWERILETTWHLVGTRDRALAALRARGEGVESALRWLKQRRDPKTGAPYRVTRDDDGGVWLPSSDAGGRPWGLVGGARAAAAER